MNDQQKDVFYSLFYAFKILFVCWLIGFFYNPIVYKTPFELKSVWDGVTILSGQGMLKMLMYAIDSALNSRKGEHPYVEAVVDAAKSIIDSGDKPEEGVMSNQTGNVSRTETNGFRGQE